METTNEAAELVLKASFEESNRILDAVSEKGRLDYSDFEDIARAQAMADLERLLNRMVESGKFSNLVEAAGHWSREFQQDLLFDRPRFNSTSPMSNAVEEVVFEAKFEFAKEWCRY